MWKWQVYRLAIGLFFLWAAMQLGGLCAWLVFVGLWWSWPLAAVAGLVSLAFVFYGIKSFVRAFRNPFPDFRRSES